MYSAVILRYVIPTKVGIQLIKKMDARLMHSSMTAACGNYRKANISALLYCQARNPVFRLLRHGIHSEPAEGFLAMTLPSYFVIVCRG